MSEKDIVEKINQIEDPDSDLGSDIEEMSEDELNLFLHENDPEFLNDIEKRKKNLKQVIKEKKIKKKPIFKLNKNKLLQVKSIPNKLKNISMPRVKKIDFKTKISSSKKIIIEFFRNILHLYKKQNLWLQLKKKALGWSEFDWGIRIVLSLIVLTIIYFLIVSPKQLSVVDYFFTTPVHSWESIAEETYEFKGYLDLVNNSIISEQDFIVLLKKIVINLRPEDESLNPLAGIELHLNVNKENIAVLLKEDENKITDFIQRALEVYSYSELSTQLGKSKIKDTVKNTINSYIGSDSVKGVYIKSIMLMP